MACEACAESSGWNGLTTVSGDRFFVLLTVVLVIGVLVALFNQKSG
jgi:hypothetical protein